MKAIIHEGKNGLAGLAYKEMTTAKPKAGEVRVQLKAAGMNHRDLFVLERHSSSEPPLIIGSDGAGIIEAVGDDVKDLQIGDEVIINPGLGWDENTPAPPDHFEILGLPDHGTFAEYITIAAKNVFKKPKHLQFIEAGVLPLAALTAYRALFTRGNIQANQTLLLPGIGGGVATFILQFAKAIGATVYVTSRSAEKRQAALSLGADRAIDSNADWSQALNNEKVDLVIESVGAATFNQSLAQLRKGGTIVAFGSSTGDTIHLNLRDFFYGQYNFLGSTMGSAEEFQEMLDFIDTHQIKPIIDEIYPLNEFHDAFLKLQNAKQFGKIAFQID